MNIIISITLLLLSTAAVKSCAPLEFQTEEEDDFTPQVKENADDRMEERGPFPFACQACRSVVEKVRKELGRDSSRRNVERVLDKACRKVGRLLRSACKSILRRFKNQLVDAIINGGSPRSVCSQARLC
uniref:antimicrobial peptide NK-lysin n=1 Tax=Semicossyphus pulcher TaxID=241346 RepID=UPI0037E808E6